MFLVLGLGNPGARYRDTRHNAGFLVVDRVASREGLSCDRKQLGALVEKVRLEAEDVVVAKPQSFMNLSGQVATSLRGFYKVDLEHLVVVHDDVDLPFGDVRVKVGGGHGGHNGLRDIQAKLGQAGFVRVRFGVGRPPEGRDTADYVLQAFDPNEREQLGELLDRAADAVHRVVADGAVAAMNTFNARPKMPRDPAGVPATRSS